MEDFKKTPKLVTLNPLVKPLPRFIPSNKLLSPVENKITEENGKYILWIKQSDEKIDLVKAVSRNLLLSDLIVKAKDMREAQRDCSNFEGANKHPKKLELLSYAEKQESEFDAMLKKLQEVVQKKLF